MGYRLWVIGTRKKKRHGFPAPITHHPLPVTQRGNVFLIILIGIVLFAALIYALSRGMRAETTTTMTKREAELAAADILAYAQRIERAVSKLRQRGISENDLDFTNAAVAGYEHTPVLAASYQIFATAGGGVAWQKPQPGVNDGSSWLFTGRTCIVNVGAGGAGCESNSAADEELIAVLPGVTASVCQALNKRLGVTGIPANAGTGYSTTLFTGTFADGTVPDNTTGLNAACFDGGAGQAGYHFYYVLLAR